MKGVNLRTMSVDGLIDLRENIDRILSTKVAAAKRDLQSRLARLDFLVGERAGRKGRHGPRKGIKIAPKYRGPDGETWAGRGARPRWLRALLKRGRKIEEFAINKTVAVRKKAVGKRSRRKRG
jgi:DNA-binding protein H-NS